MKEEIKEAQLFDSTVQRHAPGETGNSDLPKDDFTKCCMRDSRGEDDVRPCAFAKSNISSLFMQHVFVFQFRVSEVKGLHHSMSCMAYIFVTLFAVQMLVSKK